MSDRTRDIHCGVEPDLRQRDDGAHLEVIRDVHHRHGNRFVDMREHVFEPVVGCAPEGLVLLGAHAQLGHRLHRAYGEFADGGLGREHHRVGAVHDGVRHVRNLGASRRGRVDHRLEHLRGRDAHLIARACKANQALLQTGHRRVTHFDRKVAARHHDHVAGVDNVADVLHRLGTLDLRDDVPVPTRCPQQRPRLFRCRPRCVRTIPIRSRGSCARRIRRRGDPCPSMPARRGRRLAC